MVHLFCRENNWGGQRHSSFSILVFAIKRKRKGGRGLFLPRVSLFLIILGNARWQVGKCFYEGFFFLPFFSLSFSPFFRIHFAILSSRIQRELVENFNTFVERIVGNSSHPCRALFWIEQWFWYSINFYNCINTFRAHLAILFLSNICKKKNDKYFGHWKSTDIFKFRISFSNLNRRSYRSACMPWNSINGEKEGGNKLCAKGCPLFVHLFLRVFVLWIFHDV